MNEAIELAKKLRTLAFIVIPIGLIIAGFVDPRISLAMVLFGWGMNLENKARELLTKQS